MHKIDSNIRIEPYRVYWCSPEPLTPNPYTASPTHRNALAHGTRYHLEMAWSHKKHHVALKISC